MLPLFVAAGAGIGFGLGYFTKAKVGFKKPVPKYIPVREDLVSWTGRYITELELNKNNELNDNVYQVVAEEFNLTNEELNHLTGCDFHIFMQEAHETYIMEQDIQRAEDYAEDNAHK